MLLIFCDLNYPCLELRLTYIPSHLIISEDGDRIYLTFVRHDQSYLDYLKNGAPTRYFLEMEWYGPRGIYNAPHMRELAEIILAFVLHARDGR